MISSRLRWIFWISCLARGDLKAGALLRGRHGSCGRWRSRGELRNWLSAKLRDPAPGAGQLETTRLARSQHLRPRPRKPAPGCSHFSLGWRTLQPARRGHGAVGVAREMGAGVSERWRLVCSGALEASEDKSPRLHQLSG